MKPLNLIALLLFLGGAVWALTRSERTVREIQNAYYSAIVAVPEIRLGNRNPRPRVSRGNPPLQGTRSRTRSHPRATRPPAAHRIPLPRTRIRKRPTPPRARFQESHQLRCRRRPRHPPQSHHLVADGGDRRRLQTRHRHPARRALQRGPRRQDRPHRQRRRTLVRAAC